MSNFSNHNGIMIPESARPVGVQCGFCPKVIFKQNEAGGRLFIAEKEGLPICARCRVLRGRMARVIRRDVDKYEKDKDRREKAIQQAANEKAAEIAKATQIATETQITKDK